jgi:hypothetical protein
MEEFTIKGDNGFLKINIDEVYGFPKITSPFGGYDIKNILEINSGNFGVKSTVYSTTGELFDFYEQLQKANEILKGNLYLRNFENNLDAEIKYDVNGRVTVLGNFREHSEFSNLLKFEFSTDQSYIQSTLKELKTIVEKYGGMQGVK